jgi:hypothetical protein
LGLREARFGARIRTFALGARLSWPHEGYV